MSVCHPQVQVPEDSAIQQIRRRNDWVVSSPGFFCFQIFPEKSDFIQGAYDYFNSTNTEQQ